LAVVAENLADGHLLIEAAFFRQIPDLVPDIGGFGPPQDRDFSVIGDQDVHDHPDGGGFP
jgi:hypothetical protein